MSHRVIPSLSTYRPRLASPCDRSRWTLAPRSYCRVDFAGLGGVQTSHRCECSYAGAILSSQYCPYQHQRTVSLDSSSVSPWTGLWRYSRVDVSLFQRFTKSADRSKPVSYSVCSCCCLALCSRECQLSCPSDLSKHWTRGWWAAPSAPYWCSLSCYQHLCNSPPS